MIAINPKVYNILLEDEKMAIGLQLGLNKSTWEGGEIMGKSHYKYLEIRYRGEKYIKMFTEHFKLYDNIAPDCVEGTKYVIRYLSTCIETRKKPFEVLAIIQKSFPEVTKSEMGDKITEHIHYWLNSENPHNQVFVNLVKEFDRWNNFRILPKEVQEPSAFKRRIKNFYKKHIKSLAHLPEISIDQLNKIFGTTKQGLYWPHLYGKGFKITKVKNIKQSREIFSNMGFYLFTSKEEAEKYIIPVVQYMGNNDRDCRDGLEFWPKYRESIQKAFNYNEVQNIVPQRKYLDLALKKLQFI